MTKFKMQKKKKKKKKKKVTKTNLRIIYKPYAHFQTTQKTPVSFKKIGKKL